MFSYRDLGIFFIALNTYGSTRHGPKDPDHNYPYVNCINPQLEAEVHAFLTDLKEYLAEKN